MALPITLAYTLQLSFVLRDIAQVATSYVLGPLDAMLKWKQKK